MSWKLIITAAITGGVHIPSMSPYLPITPEQIIDEAVAANKAGAAVVHLHARDPQTGRPNSDPALMKQIVDGIRSKCNVVVGITTGGAIGMSVAERLKSVPVCKAELASCNAGSVNFCFSGIADKISNPKYDWEIPFVKNTYDLPFVNTFQGMEDYIRVMGENGTKPEFEIYESGMINNIAYFVQKGMLTGKVYLQFVLGILGGMPATIDNLNFLLQQAKNAFGDNFVWSCAAAGRQQYEIVTTAMFLGGGARVGLEDNLFLAKGVPATSNAECVSRMCDIAAMYGYEVATADEARARLLP